MGIHLKNIRCLVSAENGYTINLVQMQKEAHTQSLKKDFVCVGFKLPIEVGEEYVANGKWELGEKGLRFMVNQWEVVPEREATQEKTEALIREVMVKAEQNGKTCLARINFNELMQVALKSDNQFSTEDNIDQALLKLLEKKELTMDQKMIYRTQTYENVTRLAWDIHRLSLVKRNILSKSVVEQGIKDQTNRTGIVLAREQKNAMIRSLGEQISIIMGDPGTGKTTIVRGITNEYLKHFPDAKIRLLSPTGKASQELNKGLQEHIDLGTQETAKTIHGHLGIIPNDQTGGYDIVKDVTITDDFLIVDEASMIDLALAKELFRSTQNGTKVVILGDTQQLESIGLGNVLYDLIHTHVIPTSNLTRVFRQGLDSLININASMIKRGNVEMEYGSDFKLFSTETFEESATMIIDYYFELLRTEAIEDIMILSPYRKKTASGVDALNKVIQGLYNPKRADKNEMSLNKKTYREGDRIVFMKNSAKPHVLMNNGKRTSEQKQIMNGEVGTIISINKENVEIKLDKNNASVVISRKDSDLNIDLSYATTVHKSQGSEYKHVIFTINKDHHDVKRNLVYTAITRAKKTIAIVGEEEALKNAIANVGEIEYSPLQEKLIEYKAKQKRRIER